MDSSGARLRRSRTPPPYRNVKFVLGNEVRKYDSVDSLMDRIDDELSDMKLEIPNRRRPNHRTRSLSRLGDLKKRRPFRGKSRSLSTDNSYSDSGLALSLGSNQFSTSAGSERWDATSTPLPVIADGTSTDGSDFTRARDGESYDRHTDIASLPLPPPSKHMNTFPASLHSDRLTRERLPTSILITEPSDDVPGLDGVSVRSDDTPRTEDFEAAFQASLVKQVAGVSVDNFPDIDSDSDTINTNFVQRKLRESGADIEDIISSTGPDTLDEMSDLDRDRANLERYQHDTAGTGRNYDASSESEVDGDMAREIREESVRIQKEIELERKANRLRNSAFKLRDTTPKTRDSMTYKEDTASSKSREMTPKSREMSAKSRETTPKSRETGISGWSDRLTPGSFVRSADRISNIGVSTAAPSEVSAPSLTSSRPSFQARKSRSHAQAADGDLIEELNNEKLRLLGEINDLQKKMRSLEQDLQATEQQAKNNRSKAEEARSQLMLAEFKKDTALKEFTQLSSELERGRQLQASLHLESAQRIPITDLPSAPGRYGLTSVELSDLLSERNQLRAIIDDRNSSAQLEKKELECLLETAKQELHSEQRERKEEMGSLEANLEQLTSQLGHITTEKETKCLELDSYRAKNHRLEQNIRDLEKSKLQAIMDRDKELEILKETTQRDTLEMRLKLNNDLNNSNKLLKISEEKCAKLQIEIQHRDDLNNDLREECTILHSKTADEEESHDQRMREMNRKLAAAYDQKNTDLEVLKAQMEIEHLSIVEGRRADLESQHEQVLLTIKEDYDSQLSQQQQLINGKEEEICLLRSRLTQQEEATRKLAERLKADTLIQLEQAVQNERHMWEKEHKYMEGSQLKNHREEAEKQQNQLKEQLESEQRRCRQLDDQYRALKSELEEQRHQNQKLYEEKLSAISHSKKAAQEETNLQIEKIRQHLEEDTERVLDKLRSELTQKEDELRSMRNECQTLQQQEADASLALEKLEKVIVNEINDECRKTAHLLGVTPRKAQASGFDRGGSPSRAGNRRRTRSITASAIANLRACNEELRNNVKELKEDVDSVKSSLYKSKKSRESEIEEMRRQLYKDKGHDMDDLRVRLTQEHKEQIDHICSMVIEQGKLSRMLNNRDEELRSIHHNIDSWKDDTANRMADKFSQELHNQLKVYLKRLEQKLADKTLRRSLKDSVIKTPGARYNDELSVDDLGASPQLRRSVQNRIRQLRTRSSSRGRQTSLSTPDLSLNHTDGATSAMEQRVKLAELKAQLAEERATRNQALLGQKLQEVNHLQNTLNSQTKEIISLERSFEDLKQSSPPGLASHHSVRP